jgi:hypothetical protein
MRNRDVMLPSAKTPAWSPGTKSAAGAADPRSPEQPLTRKDRKLIYRPYGSDFAEKDGKIDDVASWLSVNCFNIRLSNVSHDLMDEWKVALMYI